jgi:hypothetical protein
MRSRSPFEATPAGDAIRAALRRGAYAEAAEIAATVDDPAATLATVVAGNAEPASVGDRMRSVLKDFVDEPPVPP